MQEALEQVALNIQHNGLLKTGKVKLLDHSQPHTQNFDAAQ